MARGLSQNRQNELIQEIIAELTDAQEIYMLQAVILQIQKMPMDLLELFENSLSLDPGQRWGTEEAARSRWMQNGPTWQKAMEINNGPTELEIFAWH